MSVRWTALVLRSGGLLAVAIFALGLVLRLLGSLDAASTVSTAGVLVVIATPPAALLTTIAETWPSRRATALLALAVLGVLGLATLVAIAL